jgi:formate dehydrogenase subunit gamma
MLRLVFAFFVQLMLCFSLLPGLAVAQDAGAGVEIDRSATGGAQNLNDILARQRGQALDDRFRSDNTGNPDAAAAITQQLGTLGGTSDPELWRQLR